MAHTYNPSTWEDKAEGLQIWVQPGLHSETLSQENKGQGCRLVTEWFPSMCKVLGSMTKTTPKKNEEKKKDELYIW
jgi:hypothetical protein